MAGFKEFKERITSDKAFAAKFVGVNNEAQIIAIAKAEGYDLEQLSDEELDAVAAGGLWDYVSIVVDATKSVGGFVKDKMVKPMVDNTTDISRKITDTILEGIGVKKFVENGFNNLNKPFHNIFGVK